MTEPRFKETFCSQCGKSLGPGDSGVSHCHQHDPLVPCFVAQNSIPVERHRERWVWFNDTAAEGRAQGADHFRASIHPEMPDIILLEGWKQRPDDEGEPRFMLKAPG